MRRLLIVTLVGAALVGIGSTSASAETIGGEQLAQRGVQVNLGPKAKPVPDIAAETWILVDATTGTVLAAKDPHLQRPPASTLKTLTAITVLPQVTLDQTYVATTKDTHLEGARVGLIAGKSYTLEQLFYGMFLRSGDAATAIARAPGSVKKTIARMNEVARDLQALDTTAKTPNGLDRPGQVSSAYDLALIARAGLARPDFARFVGTKMFNFPGQGSSTYAIYNQNRLLMGGFRGAVGVKTGYTSNAGRTFVGAATRKGTTLIFVGMGIHEPCAGDSRTTRRSRRSAPSSCRSLRPRPARPRSPRSSRAESRIRNWPPPGSTSRRPATRWHHGGSGSFSFLRPSACSSAGSALVGARCRGATGVVRIRPLGSNARTGRTSLADHRPAVRTVLVDAHPIHDELGLECREQGKGSVAQDVVDAVRDGRVRSEGPPCARWQRGSREPLA